LVFSPGNPTQRLSRGGAVLGVFAHWQYEEEEIRLSSGDRVLMYTDGVTESHNAGGEEFGENQLLDLVCRLPGGDAYG
jgi:phosphoserine phosphatase RsbU/P